MNRKTEASYKHILQYIENNVCSLQCVSFMTDFEIAMRNAIRDIYPDSQLNTCWFHLTQATKRKVVKYSELTKLITTNEDARKIYKKLLALPLLPATGIYNAFIVLKADALSVFGNIFAPFLKYYENQWLKKVYYIKYQLH